MACECHQWLSSAAPASQFSTHLLSTTAVEAGLNGLLHAQKCCASTIHAGTRWTGSIYKLVRYSRLRDPGSLVRVFLQPHEGVEEGRLADVGPSYQGYFGQVGCGGGNLPWRAKQPRNSAKTIKTNAVKYHKNGRNSFRATTVRQP